MLPYTHHQLGLNYTGPFCFYHVLLLLLLLLLILSTTLHYSSSAGSPNSTGLTEPITSYLLFCRKLPDCTALNITVFCIRIYRAGRRLSSFKLSCHLYGITPAVDSTGANKGAAYSCSTLISCSLKPV